jgi:hypothetical protein
MVSVTVSSAGHPPSFARGLPFTAEITGKDDHNVTVADIKAAVAAKFPEVRSLANFYNTYSQLVKNVVLSGAPKDCFKDR